MRIPCKDIANALQEDLKFQTHALTSQGQFPQLVTILLGNAPEQLSFVTIKKRLAKTLGIGFEFVHLPQVPDFQTFLNKLDVIATKPSTSGIIVQHPLPTHYDHDEIYRHMSIKQDIEGHKPHSPFIFPLALSALTGLKYTLLYQAGKPMQLKNIKVNFQEDTPLFAHHLQNKRIVIAGRGATGGGPIADAFDKMGISYVVTHSQTKNPDQIYTNADIIISATGKHIITSNNIKQGVVLLNVGLRKKNGTLRGDFEEEDIKYKASWYNQTPGGLGPIDVLYLYSNLLESICCTL